MLPEAASVHLHDDPRAAPSDTLSAGAGRSRLRSLVAQPGPAWWWAPTVGEPLSSIVGATVAPVLAANLLLA